MSTYNFLKKGLLRIPMAPIEIDITKDKILEHFKDKNKREALYIASPNIFNMLERYEKGELPERDRMGLFSSLYKYLSRLTSRCTPFGKFASVSNINFDKNSLIDIEGSKIKSVTKLDSFFLNLIKDDIEKNNSIRKVLRYYPNTSIYSVSDKYRYVEYYLKKEQRFHLISEVEFNIFLEKILKECKEGIVIDKIVKAIITLDNSIIEDEAIEFIHTIIDSQFIISELDFNLSGEDYLERLIKTLNQDRFNFEEGIHLRNRLTQYKDTLNELDKNNSDNKIEIRQNFYKEIQKNYPSAKEEHLYQVDTFRQLLNNSVEYNVLKKLRLAMKVLNKFQSSTKFVSNLDSFKTKFIERYEYAEVPITEALDPDLGINYTQYTSLKMPLIDNAPVELNIMGMNKIEMDYQKQYFIKKIIDAKNDKKTEIKITDDELNALVEREDLYSDSFSTIFQIISEEQKDKIYIKAVFNPSATSIIGRFCHLDKSIHDIADEISSQEEKYHEDKIIAEIIHLPQTRAGNILYRKFTRPYEIPYLGKSHCEDENQISITDLYVSIEGSRVVLKSKSLNKEIIPKLGNAHNYKGFNLPLYQFLCDLQTQSGVYMLNTHQVQQFFDYVPRISYKNIILQRAKWDLRYMLFEEISETNYLEKLREHQRKHNIPNIVNLSFADNEIVINFSNDLSLYVLYTTLRKQQMVSLKEFLGKEPSITGSYSNEFIAFGVRNSENSKKEESAKYEKFLHKSQLSIRDQIDSNKYTPCFTGDNWLYYKFYCGEKTAESVLYNVVETVVNKLKEGGYIKKWFFIRYFDSLGGFHIRFRVLLSDQNKIGEVILLIKSLTNDYTKHRLIWKIQIDTYQKEIYRYGANTMELSESIFYCDSESTLKFSKYLSQHKNESIRWLYGIASIKTFFNDWGLSLEEQIEIAEYLKTSFGYEFNRGEAITKFISNFYKEHLDEIESFTNDLEKEDNPFGQILEQRSKDLKPYILELKKIRQENNLQVKFYTLLISYIHMLSNRLFLDKQRMHEMVIYDIIYRTLIKDKHKGNRVDKKPKLILK